MPKKGKSLFTFLLLTITVIGLFGAKQTPALLVIADASRSGQQNKEINLSLNMICDDVKSKLDPDPSALFAQVRYADHAESTRQWHQSNKVPESSCKSLAFDALQKGTNVRSGILEGQELLNKLNKEQDSTKLTVVVLVDADELNTNRKDLVEALRSLHSSIEKRQGKLIIMSGSYDGLRRDIQSGLQGRDITYCSPKAIQDCDLTTVIKRPSDWSYSFRKLLTFGKA
jgi:hypothetical protein